MFRKDKGFTLIELLVVISIIALLSSVVLASVNTAREKTRNAIRKGNMDQISKALALYAFDHDGHYPVTKGACLGMTSSQICANNLKGNDALNAALAPYMKTVPVDPFPARAGNAYVYSSPVAALAVTDVNGNAVDVSGYGTDSYQIGYMPEGTENRNPTFAECAMLGGYWGKFYWADAINTTGDGQACGIGACRQCAKLYKY
jgi:type II secretion system protein G